MIWFSHFPPHFKSLLYMSGDSRPVLSQKWMRIDRRHCKLPSASLIGCRVSRIWNRTHTLSLYSSLFAPISCREKIELLDFLMRSHFLKSAAKVGTSTIMSCESYGRQYRSKSTLHLWSIEECPHLRPIYLRHGRGKWATKIDGMETPVV